MRRREFLASIGCFIAGSAISVPAFSSTGGHPVRIRIDPQKALGAIPPDFTGLGYEISSVAKPHLLTAANSTYVQLVRTLGEQGVIRIGGNTSDFASFSAEGKAVSAPKDTVVNEAGLRDLGTFLDATGWKLIWGLNLGSGSEQQAVDEASAVATVAKDKLLAFEIGNETNIFHGSGHRPASYSYADYLAEYHRYKAAIRAKLPDAPFAGPDSAGATEWVTDFARDEGKDLKLLTDHYYRQGEKNPTSTLSKLLVADPGLASMLKKLQAASLSSGVPYRICETNSFFGGGRPGVSDTFGAALWALDYMWVLASASASGLNMETGTNDLGFVSSYSPIGEESGVYSAKPPYYGMLAFAYAGHGQRVAVDLDAAGVNLTAYATLGSDKRLRVTVINKDASQHAEMRFAPGGTAAQVTALRLTAPSLESKSGVTLGGSPVSENGHWEPGRLEPVKMRQGCCDLQVPAGSAVILTFE